MSHKRRIIIFTVESRLNILLTGGKFFTRKQTAPKKFCKTEWGGNFRPVSFHRVIRCDDLCYSYIHVCAARMRVLQT